MAKIRPLLKLSYGRQNEPIRIPIAPLLIGAAGSFLNNDFATGQSSITVQNIYGFAVNELLFIGKSGIESSEFIKTSSSVAPSGSTVTLASSTIQAHSNSDQVYIVPFDQVEISYSPTLTGSKTVLSTVNMDVEEYTTYYDTTITSGFYFARFKNSITSAFSDYSDGCPVGSYALNTARWIIDVSLDEINKTTSDVFSDEFGFKELNKCQMEVLREQKRWSWMQVFGATTECSVGNWRIAMPADIDDNNTNKSIFNLKLGGDPNMTWVAKDEWDNIIQGIGYSSLKSTLNINDATVTLSDSSNFAASGTIQIGNDTLSYTANNTVTGALTLAVVSTVTYPTGQDLFQNATFGTPIYYTLYAGFIWHYPLADTLHDKQDYSLDYYSTLTPILNDTDTIVVPDPVLCSDYLRWKFLKRMNNGEETDGSLEAKQCFTDRKNKLVQKEVMNRKIVMTPRFNDYSKLNVVDGDSKAIRVQGFLPPW